MSSQKWLTYRDLKERGIFNSRMTLSRAVETLGFPRGRLITPNSRKWPEDEVVSWIACRPEESKKA